MLAVPSSELFVVGNGKLFKDVKQYVTGQKMDWKKTQKIREASQQVLLIFEVPNQSIVRGMERRRNIS